MKTLKWGLLYTAAFLAAFVGSALLKMNSDPTHGKYNTRWDETVGKAYTDLPYGEGAANKFDLWVCVRRLPATWQALPPYRTCHRDVSLG